MAAKAPATRIQRSGNGHSYYLDGEKCPGVTTIIGNGVPKHLEDWAAKMTAQFVVNGLAEVEDSQGRTRVVADRLVANALQWNATRTRPERVSGSGLDRLALEKILKDVRYADRDEAANRGTEVHGLAERLAHGETVGVPPEIAGHVASYVRFLDEWDPSDAMVERVVINRQWGYMGKSDLIASFARLPDLLAEWIGKDSGRGLLDVKTSRSGVYTEAGLQTWAYAACETMIVGQDGSTCVEEALPPIDFCAAIWVRHDGYDVFAFRPDPRWHRTFLYAKYVGEFMEWKEGPAQSLKSAPLPAPVRAEVAS